MTKHRIQSKKRTEQSRIIELHKPNFSKLFFPIWMSLLFITICISVLSTIIMLNWYKDNKIAKFEKNYIDLVWTLENSINSQNELLNMTEKHPATRNDTSLNNLLKWHLCSVANWESNKKSNFRCAAVLCNSNGSIYMDSSESIFLIQHSTSTSNRQPQVLICNPNIFSKVFTYMKKYEAETLNSNENSPTTNYWFSFEDIYIDDSHFLPGIVNIICQDTYESDKIVKQLDLTPPNTKNYTHKILDYDNTDISFSYPMIKGNAVDDATLIKLSQDPFGNNAKKNSLSSLFTGEFIYTKGQRIVLSEKQSKFLFVSQSWNFYSDYGIYICLTHISMILLSLLASGIWAYRKYVFYQAHYEMTIYRQELTNTMAHDLKSPLSAISGYAENLQQNIHNERRIYYASKIIDNIQYTNQLIEHILKLAQTEQTNITIKKEVISVAKIIQEQLSQQESSILQKEIKVNKSGEKNLLTDPIIFKQILNNLICNAIKYTPIKGEISISIYETGMILKNETAEILNCSPQDLWNPFTKGNDSRGTKSGAGIGLSIVRNLAKILEIQITLDINNNEFIVEIQW